MSLNAVQIANLALKRIGIKQRLIALTDSTAEAAACLAGYAASRDYVLGVIDWPFAMRYATLALVEEDPSDDWLFSYSYPTDCIKLRRIVSPSGRSDQVKIPFDLGVDDDEALLIYTDQEDAVVQFTAAIENTVIFSPTFANCVAWRLASEIAFPLSVTASIRTDAETLFRNALSEAAAIALNEGQRDEASDSEFTRARE